MKVTPVLFSGPMIRALISGGKTQTRRVVKPQPSAQPLVVRVNGKLSAMWREGFGNQVTPCPYGQPGDLLVPALAIPGLDDRYCADICGNIWSSAKGEWRCMKGSPNSRGYLTITPAVDGKYKTKFVHRLICEAYYGPPPDGMSQTRHLDGNQLNNAPVNLDWGTQEQNWSDRAAHGSGIGEQHHNAKLTEAHVQEIRRLAGTNSQRSLADRYGVSQSQIWCVVNDRTWGDERIADPPNMPRWASRLTLRLTDVRVERVQEIADHGDGLCRIDDLEAEGLDQIFDAQDDKADSAQAVEWFACLWDALNAERGYPWESNPWVWALSFEVIHENVDAVLAREKAA